MQTLQKPWHWGTIHSSGCQGSTNSSRISVCLASLLFFPNHIDAISTSIVVLSWQESGLSLGDIDPSTYWRALVKEIRQSKNGKVWLKVNWFYSVEHLLQPGTLEEQWSIISLIPIYLVLTHNYTQSRHTFNHGKKWVSSVQSWRYH